MSHTQDAPVPDDDPRVIELAIISSRTRFILDLINIIDDLQVKINKCQDNTRQIALEKSLGRIKAEIEQEYAKNEESQARIEGKSSFLSYQVMPTTFM
jgi:hypothetical protein